ncbi:MAG: hypothetical protein KC561_05830, partial [Myxococcales bacterium]|nr:hypothetical protein [Myxococcales bacterium]
LDSYDAPEDIVEGNPWPNALPRQNGECWSLPHGPGHGYPAGESEYDLGVTVAERPAGIGLAYGYESFRWMYGDTSWYGHDGIASQYIGHGGTVAGTHLSFATTYRNGVMVSEYGELEGTEDSRLIIDRTRELVDGRLVSDRVEVRDDSSGAPAVRDMVFEQGPQGLLSRELWSGDTLLARQEWDRDSQGTVTAHRVTDQPLASDTQEWPLLLHSDSGEAVECQWVWTYDDAHRLQSRASQPSADNVPSLSQTVGYDEQGRWTEKDGFWENTYVVSESREFDVMGNLSEECTYWSEDSFACQSYTYQEQGLRLTTHTQNQSGEPVLTDNIAYRCED